VYYQAGSLKARLCVSGNQRMRAYCRERGLPINECGKVIVARTSEDLPALEELHRRAQANGIGASIIDAQTLRELEPYAKTTEKALYVKDTAVVAPQVVMGALLEDAQKEGVMFEFNCPWEHSDTVGKARTARGIIAYGHLVNCAGLFADRIAHAFGVGKNYRILPFLGKFSQLSPHSKIQVRGNIYPVPDLRNPFLGIHFTRRPTGEVIIGPSALPLLGREQYSGLKGANSSDAFNMGKYMVRLFSKNRDHFRSLALKEIGNMTKKGFYHEAAGLVNGLEPDDLVVGKSAGIRAQLVNIHTSELLNDFVIEPGIRSTHILNANSPAFTSALPFAEHVVQTMQLAK
jgi:L-2-hydroxyglutarate oxidase LhgO